MQGGLHKAAISGSAPLAIGSPSPWCLRGFCSSSHMDPGRDHPGRFLRSRDWADVQQGKWGPAQKTQPPSLETQGTPKWSWLLRGAPLVWGAPVLASLSTSFQVYTAALAYSSWRAQHLAKTEGCVSQLWSVCMNDCCGLCFSKGHRWVYCSNPFDEGVFLWTFP